MLNKEIHKYLALLLFFSLVFCQTFNSVDTIYQSKNQKYYKLKNKLIIKSSLKIKNNEILINPIYIDSIFGLIYLAEKDFETYLIAEYSYLENNYPMEVGPLWNGLPLLNEKALVIKGEQKTNKKISSKDSELYSSGSFNRELSFFPKGGSGFSGGFQMQFNGKLSKDIDVQGVLNDQSVPFQPEGVTRELEELDQIYINITHPNFSFNIGDIYFKANVGNQLGVERKLIGIKNKFKINEWEGNSIFANSSGEYIKNELKGQDGVQGPYYLKSKKGNKNIIILAGTEEVWLDGKKLIRGHNNDYKIDYNMAEIYFTSRNLIHSDSDILLKYQYSNFEYTKLFNGASFKKAYKENNNFEIGIFREIDNITKDSSAKINEDIFSNIESNEVLVSTVSLNENGDYVKAGNIFIYKPNQLDDTSIRYSILFEFDSNGNYKKMISANDRIYYEHIPLNEKDSFEDYYSPFKVLSAPKSHHYGFIKNKFKLNKFLNIDSYIVGTELNQNVLFNGEHLNDQGYSYNIKSSLDPFFIGNFKLNIFYVDQKRSEYYEELGSKNEARQQRLWNLDSNIIKGVNERSLSTEVIMNEISKTKISFSDFKTNLLYRSKLKINQLFINPFLQNSYLNLTSVKGAEHNFLRYENQLQLNFNKINPFIKHIREEIESDKIFNYIAGGFRKERTDYKIETGISFRKDEVLDNSLAKFQNSNDFIGFLEYKNNIKQSLKKKLTFRKRLKTFNLESNKESYDYSLLDFSLRYNKRENPLEWRFYGSAEESFLEKRSIIYDSVGVGLGQYRYDKSINTYVPDQNGSFVSYTIYTGNLEPSTVIESSQDFNYNFNMISFLPQIHLRGNLKQKVRGDKINFSNILNPNINKNDLSILNLYSRYEIIIKGSIRVLGWNENFNELNGLDYRGNNLTSKKEYGLKVNKNIFKNLSIENNTQYKLNKNKSSYYIQRNRSSSGIWNELNFKINIGDNNNVDFIVLYGLDDGYQSNVPFQSRAIGSRLKGIAFLNKNGRIETEISYVIGKETNGLNYVPPEALNGYPLGNSLKTYTKFQYFINQSVSMIYSLNTINNIRYQNLISFKGEVRAYF